MILQEKSIKLVPSKGKKPQKPKYRKKKKKEKKAVEPYKEWKQELKQEVERLSNNHMSRSVEIRCIFALL